ncbi:MAG: DUF4177 domain-containing protein [Pseudomonadota bacterium]
MRWEYKTLKYTKRSFFTGAVDAEELQQMLNDLGRDGWELVSINQTQMQPAIIVLKRPT